MKKHLLLAMFAVGLTNAQVFSENFNTGTLPTGWTVENPDTSFNWEVGTQNGFASFPSGAASFDDDNAGSSSLNSNARLISPVINLTGVANPTLTFKYANMIYDEDSTLKVEVFNGTSWVQVFTFSGDAGTWGIDLNTFMYTVDSYDQAANINLTSYVNPNFRMRFVYDDAGDYSYGAVVDDVIITSGVLATAEMGSIANNVKLYPNPVKDFLFIKSNDTKISKISVIDMSGKQLKTFDGKLEKYNLADLPSGIYIVLIDNGTEIIKKKIIKK